jgi:5-methylcytosine-specific restriction endonuclease McrA
MEHRRPEIRFSDAEQGTCRWCGEAILHSDGEKAGTINRRRRWHPECVEIYNASDPREARRRIRRRDRGICAECRVDTYAVRREIKKIGRGRTRELRSRGYKPRQSLWELDHIVPLIDGGTHDDENLQTLCTPCHTRKTAAEARARAERARAEIAESGDDSPAAEDTSEPTPRAAPAPRGGRKRARASLEDLLSAADATNSRVQALLEEITPR